VKLSGEVECDEVYIVARHKGRPDVVAKLGRLGRRRRLKGAPGRGTLAGFGFSPFRRRIHAATRRTPLGAILVNWQLKSMLSSNILDYTFQHKICVYRVPHASGVSKLEI
jgi:hypothetical protein